MSLGISSFVYRYLENTNPVVFRGEANNLTELPAILAYYNMYHKSNKFEVGGEIEESIRLQNKKKSRRVGAFGT